MLFSFLKCIDWNVQKVQAMCSLVTSLSQMEQDSSVGQIKKNAKIQKESGVLFRIFDTYNLSAAVGSGSRATQMRTNAILKKKKQ